MGGTAAPGPGDRADDHEPVARIDAQHPEGPPTGGSQPHPVPVPVRTHRWGLGAFLLVEAVFLAMSAVVAGLLVLWGEGLPPVEAILVGLLVPPLVAAGLALLITRLRGNGPRRDLGLVWSWRDVAVGLAFGICGLFLTGIASAVFVAVVGPDVTSSVGAAFGSQRAGPFVAVMVLLAVVVVVPFCEEILYRGLLWGGLERLGANRWLAFAVTTVIFALFHFEVTRAPLLLVISIPLGLARLYTGRLLASVVAHQVNNLLPGIFLMLALLGLVPTV